MTLKHGEKAAGRIAADANVLLSAVTGRAALKVFTQAHLEVVSTHLKYPRSKGIPSGHGR